MTDTASNILSDCSKRGCCKCGKDNDVFVSDKCWSSNGCKCPSEVNNQYCDRMYWSLIYSCGREYLCDGCLNEVGINRGPDSLEGPPDSVYMDDKELNEFIAFVEEPIHKFVFMRCAARTRDQHTIFEEDKYIREPDWKDKEYRYHKEIRGNWDGYKGYKWLKYLLREK
jgi:hypothetical protein